MRALHLFSIWLHILSAIIWIGGTIFVALVLVPMIRDPEFRGSAARLIHQTGTRFRWVGWACLLLLVLTGVVNLAFRGFTWASLLGSAFWGGAFGQVLGLKLLVVAVILGLSVLHDFVIGPRATALWQKSPAGPEAARLRRQASWIGRLNLLLALAVTVLGVLLVRGVPW